LARLTDNTLRTVRHYEELGLIQPLDREEGGHRLFDECQLDRLRFITDMRSLSFPLASIREVLACSDGATAPCEAAKKAASVLDGHIHELKDKIRTLRRVRDTLVRTKATLEECADCDESWETRYCDDCEVRPEESPRLVDLLW
jgi:DNA-binding transcriptional MerR regulator